MGTTIFTYMEKNRSNINWIIWHVTNKCNLQCGYCFTNSSPYAEKPLSKGELLHIVGEINDSNAKLVTIIGGVM